MDDNLTQDIPQAPYNKSATVSTVVEDIGFNAQGETVDKSDERIIDMNAAIGASIPQGGLQMPDTGVDNITDSVHPMFKSGGSGSGGSDGSGGGGNLQARRPVRQ